MIESELITTVSQTYVYRLDLAYRGTGFSGWQSQPTKDAVQDEIERVLQIVLRQPIRVLGASRTDAGVHAEHQVLSFRLDEALSDLDRVLKSINALTHVQIQAFRLQLVDPKFHPILTARAKLYRYRLWLGPLVSPFALDYVWSIKSSLDLDTMREAAQLFVGVHDFASFCASDSSARTTQREIFDIQLYRSGPVVEIYILGSGFLKQMVRSMVGTLVEVGRGRRTASSISATIEAGDRRQAGQTAPAAGLSLVEIFYEDRSRWSIEDCKPLSSLSFWIHSSI